MLHFIAIDGMGGGINQSRGDFDHAAIVLVSVCLLRSHLYAASASQPLKSTHLG